MVQHIQTKKYGSHVTSRNLNPKHKIKNKTKPCVKETCIKTHKTCKTKNNYVLESQIIKNVLNCV
jgi:hypothetical protein